MCRRSDYPCCPLCPALEPPRPYRQIDPARPGDHRRASIDIATTSDHRAHRLPIRTAPPRARPTTLRRVRQPARGSPQRRCSAKRSPRCRPFASVSAHAGTASSSLAASSLPQAARRTAEVRNAAIVIVGTGRSSRTPSVKMAFLPADFCADRRASRRSTKIETFASCPIQWTPRSSNMEREAPVRLTDGDWDDREEAE